MLRGKIDDNRFKVIASRFTTLNHPATEPAKNEELSLGSAALQDLMLQAEILVQYGMRNKALERLQRIQQLFPHEEDRNPDLRQLYVAASMTPQYAGGSSHAPNTVVPATPEVAQAPALPAAPAEV